MEVYGVKPADAGSNYPIGKIAGQTAELAIQQPNNGENQGQASDKRNNQKNITRETVNEVTDEMNSIVKALNTNLQFKLHEKTKELMVQVVDIKDGTVLKEFPPHELLDTKAKIREFIGALLDKKV